MSVVLYTKLKAGGRIPTIIKAVLSLLILFQVYLDSTTGEKGLLMHNLPSKLANILEYTIAFSILGFFPLFAYDLRNFKMVYVSKKWWIY